MNMECANFLTIFPLLEIASSTALINSFSPVIQKKYEWVAIRRLSNTLMNINTCMKTHERTKMCQKLCL